MIPVVDYLMGKLLIGFLAQLSKYYVIYSPGSSSTREV